MLILDFGEDDQLLQIFGEACPFHELNSITASLNGSSSVSVM